ncbi:MAG TPA: tetratricopeptide repeat protein [Bryobacteraceae bacterium]|nr:tetratricopeptide repeat protein [Bryobacteraceae bacterium]
MRTRLTLELAAAIAVFYPLASPAWQQAPGAELRDAAAALQRSDFQAAEHILRAEVAAHPENAWALSMLGAALDKLNRIPEADAFHRRASAAAPRSTEVLNNYGAHLWLSGQEKEAGKIYRQIVALDPAHYNANLQLSRLALKAGDVSEALGCLDRLPAAQQARPEVALIRLEALYAAGDRQQADALAERLAEQARGDANLAAAAASALLNAGQFARAESLLEIALQQTPANFTVLYNLGIAATRAGHYGRARDVLQAALRQQPRNIDILYGLAYAEYASRQWEAAVQLLSQAARLDPHRADVQRLLALAATDLGALDDASAAWDRYLKLEPDDAAARRERGYTAVQRGHPEEGLADLEWFAARNPGDAAGHYELGQAERGRDLEKAMQHFDRALQIDPNYVPALAARAAIYNQQANPEEALKDLEKAARLRPDDAVTLDRLGQTYQALDRTADAVPALRKAAELAPGDSKTLLHLARALADSGSIEESKAAMDRFRQLGPEKKSGVPAGFVEYVALTDEQRHTAYRSRLQKAIREHPNDAALRVDYLKVLLGDGHLEEAAAAARAILEMQPGTTVLADAGRALLAAKQYGLACELFRTAETAGAPAAVGADLAVATRLAEAEKLQAAGDAEGARREWEQALETAPGNPDLYRQAAAFLVRNGRAEDAVRLLDQALGRFPKDRRILLLRAAAAELAGNSRAAEQSLAEIHDQWPEWYSGWALRGMVLAAGHRFEDAQKALETAIALGASGPEVYFYLAESAVSAGSPDRKAAEAAIQQALRLAPEDPWIQDLASRIGGVKASAPRRTDGPPYLVRLFP